MNTPNLWITRLLIVAVAFALCGAPQLVQAQQAADPPQAQPAQQPSGGVIDPSKGPLQPVPPSQPLPEAPSSTQAQQPETTTEQPKPQQPLGAAVGQTGPTAGGPASKPAGTAIAPAKQRQVRSLLIKLGAIAAAGAALGTVLALSKASPSRPPGAR
ncbi:MAG: hypothetical protein ACE14L_05805 [Terriglobales bacterium]